MHEFFTSISLCNISSFTRDGYIFVRLKFKPSALAVILCYYQELASHHKMHIMFALNLC
jgi:hypothetical protein